MELGITNLHKIECYDISNMQGKNAYGSMVVAIDGVLSRSHYRVFKIRSLETPNDPAMLKEVLQRRISNVGKEVDDSLNAKPDIILIDGGRSQLGVIKEYIPEDIILLGISKGKHLKRAGKRKKDEFWIVKDGEVFRLELLSPEILIDLRDEAHRFAIKHYRKRSIKESKKSKLDQIKGIGPIRKKNLIKRFKTVDGIKSAKDEELLELLKSNKILKNLREALTNQNPKA
jgi:excinuclease ABC subunit C